MQENQNQNYADFVKDRVNDLFYQNKRPIYLSYLGEIFRKKFGHPRDVLSMSLSEFISSYLPDLAVVHHPRVKQKVVVVPAGERVVAENFLDTDFRQEGEIDIGRVQNAILLAFQQNTGDSFSVYIKISRPIQFSVLGQNPDPSQFIEIEKEFLKPSRPPKKAHELSAEEVDELANNILKWLKNHSLDINCVYFDAGVKLNSPPARGGGQRLQNNWGSALTRLFESQPDDIRGRVIIPLDIAEALSRMK